MKREHTRRAGRLAWLMLAFLLLQAPVGVGAAADEKAEIEIAEYPPEFYEPGPGWPDGWTPPPAPAEMSERMRAEAERVLRERPERYDGYDWWVWDPLPAWTQEYPYYWEEDWMVCGTTMHVYCCCPDYLSTCAEHRALV